MLIPDEFTEEEKVTGTFWRQLVAGAGAGVGEASVLFLTPRGLLLAYRRGVSEYRKLHCGGAICSKQITISLDFVNVSICQPV